MKEEGEMSDDEEVYEQFKEQKWMEWCEDVLADEIKTLGRLQKLQTTSADLPKEKVFIFIFIFLSSIIHSAGHAVSFFIRSFLKIPFMSSHRCFSKSGDICKSLDEE